MAAKGTQSEVIHVHDQPTTPIVVTTAVRMSAPDVESQESTVPKAMEENTTMIDDDDNAGMGMGIAIFILIIIGTVSAFFIPYLSSACFITALVFIIALVLASVLTCGCCCAKNYNLKPHVKKMATATLVTLVLLFIVSTIDTVMTIQSFFTPFQLDGYGGYDETTGTFNDDYINTMMDEYETNGTVSNDLINILMKGYDETTGTFSDDTLYNEIQNTSVILTLSIIVYVLIGLALIFSGIFTWGRKCGAPRA
jgi:hypothetical protein